MGISHAFRSHRQADDRFGDLAEHFSARFVAERSRGIPAICTLMQPFYRTLIVTVVWLGTLPNSSTTGTSPTPQNVPWPGMRTLT